MVTGRGRGEGGGGETIDSANNRFQKKFTVQNMNI